jgi:hypothetical protein
MNLVYLLLSLFLHLISGSDVFLLLEAKVPYLIHSIDPTLGEYLATVPEALTTLPATINYRNLPKLQRGAGCGHVQLERHWNFPSSDTSAVGEYLSAGEPGVI